MGRDSKGLFKNVAISIRNSKGKIIFCTRLFPFVGFYYSPSTRLFALDADLVLGFFSLVGGRLVGLGAKGVEKGASG